MGFAGRAVRSVIGYGTLNVVRYTLSFGVQILLARLLTPEIFGIVALATTIQTFVTLVQRWGIPQAMMQEDAREQYSDLFATIFWLNLAFSVGLAVAVGAGAPVFYATFDARVVTAFYFLFAAATVKRFATPFKAVIQRSLDLTAIGVINLVALVISAIAGVWFARIGYGIWSLAVYYGARHVISAVGLTLHSPRYPSIAFDRDTARWFAGFAVGMFKSRILLSVESRGDDYIVGTVGNATALGFYSLGWRLATAFHSVVHPAIREGIMPTFSKVKGSDGESRRGVEFLIRMQLALVVPAYAFAAITAPTLVPAVFGDEWTQMTPVFQVLALAGILFPILATGRQVYYARGDPRTVLHVQVPMITVMITGLVAVVGTFGAIGAAVVVDVALAVGTAVVLARLSADVDLNPLRLIGPAGASGAVALLIGIMINSWVTGVIDAPLFRLAAVACGVGTGFVTTLFGVASDNLRDDIAVIHRAIVSR